MIDFNLDEFGPPLIDNNINFLKQQIDILFDSNPGDLIGDINYGTDYEYFLYELKLSPNQIKTQVERDINSLDLMGYSFNVNVYLMQGTERDIALIQIDLYKGPDDFNSVIYTIK